MLEMLGAIVQNVIARAHRPSNLYLFFFILLEHYNKIHTLYVWARRSV